ncbi:hypothetical protein SAMN05446934_9771 [Paraburkholderia hospita]|nr:hypothetical protein PMI06_009040 [Burkholderia sp. BT03]SKC56247.1 hypothetical protein SAMN06266956_0803 [Paraburkholderia hospita]SKD05881.1 hypothetical protein SAMN05446934_9771 [Paraburkholderia hospita]
MATPRLEHSTALLVALRVVACRYDAITERKFFGWPAFFVGPRMVACVYGDTITLKLPQLSITALMETRGCTHFQPYGRHPSFAGWHLKRVVQPLLHLKNCLKKQCRSLKKWKHMVHEVHSRTILRFKPAPISHQIAGRYYRGRQFNA